MKSFPQVARVAIASAIGLATFAVAQPATRLVVSMPRNAAGQFILADPKVVDGADYTTKINRIIDPASPAAFRVESIEYSNFALPAVNNGWAAKDTRFFSITVKLPTVLHSLPLQQLMQSWVNCRAKKQVLVLQSTT